MYIILWRGVDEEENRLEMKERTEASKTHVHTNANEGALKILHGRIG